MQLSRTSIRQNFFKLQIANLRTSLPENVIEAPTTEMFKNRFDRHCRETNLLFGVDIDMVAAPPPPLILGGDLKISDQNNWGEGNLSKKLNLGGAKFKGEPMNL